MRDPRVAGSIAARVNSVDLTIVGGIDPLKKTRFPEAVEPNSLRNGCWQVRHAAERVRPRSQVGQPATVGCRRRTNPKGCKDATSPWSIASPIAFAVQTPPGAFAVGTRIAGWLVIHSSPSGLNPMIWPFTWRES